MAETNFPEYGSPEFYNEKAKKVEEWLDEYFRLMYPDDDVFAVMTQEEVDRQVHTARVRACWIIERLAELNLTRRLPQMIRDQAKSNYLPGGARK